MARRGWRALATAALRKAPRSMHAKRAALRRLAGRGKRRRNPSGGALSTGKGMGKVLVIGGAVLAGAHLLKKRSEPEPVIVAPVAAIVAAERLSADRGSGL